MKNFLLVIFFLAIGIVTGHIYGDKMADEVTTILQPSTSEPSQ